MEANMINRLIASLVFGLLFKVVMLKPKMWVMKKAVMLL
jgi:hypothetical protein